MQSEQTFLPRKDTISFALSQNTQAGWYLRSITVSPSI